MASTAILILPSVPFLKPTGHDKPEANSLCTCDSVVRAPIAPQLIRSATYCGLITSKNSVPAGKPSSLIFISNSRAIRKPSLIRKLLSKYGSLINPFQPTVVRGFSKYTRMMISNSPLKRTRSFTKRCAYSIAALVSWIEQGPMTTINLSSSPCKILCKALRASAVTLAMCSEQGYSRMKCEGGVNSFNSRILRSSVRGMASPNTVISKSKNRQLAVLRNVGLFCKFMFT